jgi:hypothetical protein
MIARHGQSWTVPAEGGSVTIAALCDGDIPRDGGARFIGYAPASSQSDADPMAWTVIEFPAERFIEAEGGGVYIESTLEFSPGDPSLVAIPWSELTVVARCAETPPFDPALNESSYWPDPPEHLHIGLFEFPPPPPDLTLAAESVRAGHRMGFTVDCRRAKEWDVEVSVALLGDDGTTVATDVVGKTTRDPRLWIFSGSLDTSTLEPGGFVAIASCAATDASGVVTMSEPEPFVVEP